MSAHATVVGAAPAGRLRSLAGAVVIVASGFVASRVLGLLRDIVVTYSFGTGPEVEAYLAANRLPDLLFQVLAGGAVASAFIPVFARFVSEGNEEAAWRLASSAMNAAVAIIAPLALLGALLADPIMGLLIAGRPESTRQLAADLARIMLIAPALFAVSGFATSVLNTYQRFSLAAAAPALYNLAIIAGAILLRPLGIYGLAVGVAAGAALHLAVQVPGLVRLGMRYRPIIEWGMPALHEVGRLMVPRMLGLGVVQISQLVNVLLASYLAAGSIAYLNFAWLIAAVPLGIFGMAVSTAVFPTLAEHSARQQAEELQRVLVRTLRLILYLTFPASAGLLVLREPTVRLLFERGAFDSASTTATAFALGFLTLGLSGHAAVEILDRAYYALRDTRTPVVIATLAVVLNLGLGLVLMRTPLSFGGLALANSLAALGEAAVLTVLLARRLPGLPLARTGLALLRFLSATVLMAAIVAGAHALLSPLGGFGLAGQALLVGVCVLLGLVAYVGLTTALGCSEVQTIQRLLQRRA